MPDTETLPSTKEIEAAAASLRAVCERLPDTEERANALAHITTTERWAKRALDE